MRLGRHVAAVGLILLAIVIARPPSLSAQSSATGSLTGTVTDPSGGVLPGASVTVTNRATGLVQSAVTTSAGEWTVTTLPVGQYDVSVELDGFKKTTQPNVLVEAGIARRVNVTLQVGAMTEDVTVQADVPLVVSTTATTFRRINAEELTQVPTSTRSFTHLLSSEAGVSADLPPVLTNGTGNISPSVNGTRTTSTSLFFNGIDATNITSNEGAMTDNISPAPEMLEEVKLQTSLYDASTGRSGGGNFQLVTRSGGNAFHGAGFFNGQHEGLNSNDFFYEKDGIDKPKARRNESGVTVGGPLRKNRVFFFGGYQRTAAKLASFRPPAVSRCCQRLSAWSRAIGPRRSLLRRLPPEPRNPPVDPEGAVRERD